MPILYIQLERNTTAIKLAHVTKCQYHSTLLCSAVNPDFLLEIPQLPLIILITEALLITDYTKW
jgi:hypothetical protein